VQVIADGADRRGDDGLVQRREEQAQHQPAEDAQDLPVAQLPPARV